ncbi:hypothetical protein [Cuniculiplasma divulgatum]|jgi:hypothetical protein|nr:hypothetical protein [Cuniculiplasma divulgatum]
MNKQKDDEIWGEKTLHEVYGKFNEIGFVTACMKCKSQKIA